MQAQSTGHPTGAALCFPIARDVSGTSVLRRRTFADSVPPASGVFTPRWSPNGALVALVDEDGWLTVLNTRTGSVRVLAGAVDGYAWSPDAQFLAISRTIVYECADDPWEGCELGELSIVRLRNGEARQQLRTDALGTVFDWRH